MSMHDLSQHGYTLVFVLVLAEQIGLPAPSTIILLAAGAFAGSGNLNLAGVLAAGVAACMVSDAIWFWIGQKRGMKVLHLLCRISLEPDSCVRRTEESFARNQARTLLIAKFVPGLSTAAPPLAGLFRMSFLRFAALDFAGSVLWVGAFVLTGFVFHRQLELAVLWATHLGVGLVSLAALLAAGYIGWKYWHRRRFLHELRVATVRPEEVKTKIDTGQPPLIVDLRHTVDLASDPVRIPGAVHVDPADFENRSHLLPLDREVVLYCT